MGPGPVFTPPIPRGAMGHGPAEFVHGPGAMGTIGGWPRGPNGPLLGENTLARGIAGESDISPHVPPNLRASSPDGPPILGVLCREYS